MRGGRLFGAAAPLVCPRQESEPSALKHHGNVSPRILCGVLASACLLLACSAVPASAATNLIANPGFETQGAVQTVFSDTIPDGDAWRSASGGYTYGGNAITSFGIANTTDVAIIQYSQDWSDTTITVTTTPLATSANLVGGAMLRWQSGVGFYGCGVRSGALVIQRRSSSTDTVLGTTNDDGAGQHVVPGRLLRDRLDVVLLSRRRRRAAAPPPLTRTDTALTSGADGTFAVNGTNQTRQFRFSAPSVTAAVPSGWSTIVPTAGRPGLVPDRVAPANPGAESLQLFGGDDSFGGYAGQTVTVTPSTTYMLEAAISTIALTSGTARVVVTESPSGATTTLGGASGHDAVDASTRPRSRRARTPRPSPSGRRSTGSAGAASTISRWASRRRCRCRSRPAPSSSARSTRCRRRSPAHRR